MKVNVKGSKGIKPTKGKPTKQSTNKGRPSSNKATAGEGWYRKSRPQSTKVHKKPNSSKPKPSNGKPGPKNIKDVNNVNNAAGNIQGEWGRIDLAQLTKKQKKKIVKAISQDLSPKGLKYLNALTGMSVALGGEAEALMATGNAAEAQKLKQEIQGIDKLLVTISQMDDADKSKVEQILGSASQAVQQAHPDINIKPNKKEDTIIAL